MVVPVDEPLASDPTRPGPLFLAFLAAPGVVFWLGFGGALVLKPTNVRIATLVATAVLGFAAGIPALGCRGASWLRWAVCVLDCAPLIVLIYVAATLRVGG